MTLGDLLREQAIGADDIRPVLAVVLGVVDDQKMIADRIESIDVAPGQPRLRVGDGRAFLVEHAIAQPLRAADFRRIARKPHFERAEAAERFVRRDRAPGMLETAIGFQRGQKSGAEAARQRLRFNIVHRPDVGPASRAFWWITFRRAN